MSYKIKTISLNKLAIGPTGPVMPLCQSCINKDCPLPIENSKVSILGVNKPIRVHVSQRRCSLVMECDGYMNDQTKKEDENELRAISEIQERDKRAKSENNKTT